MPVGRQRIRLRSHGYIRVKGLKLHRIAWEAHNAAPIPSGMCVCHTCDNRRCFNPAHLFLGTKGENNTDRHKKGRTVLNPPQRKYDYVVIHKMYSDGKTIAESLHILALTGQQSNAS